MINIEQVIATQKASGRVGKHGISIVDDNLVIKSTTALDGIEIPTSDFGTHVPDESTARILVRGLCKQHGVKYNSSMQNIADKMYAIWESL